VSRPVLFVLCGVPFSGKSTLARAMSERLGIEHIEIDQVHEARGFIPGTDRTVTDDDWRAAFQRSFRRLHAVLAAGDSAVWDTASYRKAQRERIRAVGERYGASVYLIHLATPAAEARSRLEQNRQTGQRWDVPDDNFFDVLRDFELPGPEEQPIRFLPDLPIEPWLEATIAPLIDAAAKEQQR
jgi:predicted kinase